MHKTCCTRPEEDLTLLADVFYPSSPQPPSPTHLVQRLERGLTLILRAALGKLDGHSLVAVYPREHTAGPFSVKDTQVVLDGLFLRYMLKGSIPTLVSSGHTAGVPNMSKQDGLFLRYMLKGSIPTLVSSGHTAGVPN